MNYPTLNQIVTLLSRIIQSRDKNEEDIRRGFNERHPSSYETTMRFLINAQIAKINGNSIEIAQSINPGVESELRDFLTDKLIDMSPQDSELMLFFSNFKYDADTDGRYVYSPTIDERAHHSALRNLLLELRLIANSDDRRYLIVSKKIEQYVRELSGGGTVFTPAQLEALKVSQAQIGLAAELQVMAYELMRLKIATNDDRRVAHRSITDTSLGYDIASIDSISSLSPRYIEVKAVSPLDFGFHWSAQEVKIAKLLTHQYWLYLVPIVSGKPLTDELIAIQNPIEKVFEAESWFVQPDGYAVSRNIG